MTMHERTGWRDKDLSLRHREWGFNCPMADVDFVAVEYNLGKPVALVEYKHRGAKTPDFAHATYRAIRILADNSGIPFFVAFYNKRPWMFRVYPVNDYACQLFEHGQGFSEYDFVSKLYQLRHIVVDEDVLADCSRVSPKEPVVA